jgi:quercetin dioxygenase-like cupin family protein
VGRTISLEQALADDPDPLRAPPAWTNTALATVNGSVVLHAGQGRLDGSWHSQDSDECLVVLAGELIVEFDAGPQRAGPGEAILIDAGERHRTAVPVSCTLLSVEGAGMTRTDL